MAGLPARLPSTRHPLAAWTAAQPITGGRLAAVVATFGKQQKQVLHLCLQCCHLLPQVSDLAILGNIFRFELGDAFLISHAFILP